LINRGGRLTVDATAGRPILVFRDSAAARKKMAAARKKMAVGR
jgi:hypothetical protein